MSAPLRSSRPRAATQCYRPPARPARPTRPCKLSPQAPRNTTSPLSGQRSNFAAAARRHLSPAAYTVKTTVSYGRKTTSLEYRPGTWPSSWTGWAAEDGHRAELLADRLGDPDAN